MTYDLNFLTMHGSHQLLKSVWEISSWCWPGSSTEGVNPPASRGWLRRFLLLKLVMVLLFPQGGGIPLLVGCLLSLRALLLLRSPNISIKPSNVLLGQLALSDGLVLLRWALWLGATLAWWTEEAGCGVQTDLPKKGDSVWWREAVTVLCQQLHDAHHLASLLLLGLLGLEATLVSRWPQQTQKIRTSHWAQLSCSLVWILVLLELTLSLHKQLVRGSRPQTYSSTLQDSQTSYVDLVPPPSLSAFSPCLRWTLWLVNLGLHYDVFYGKPQQRKSSFH